eukprot:TRINITY_DN42226_c0_g1_i1.p1 TRINITY_DN42226_c0_g1~~TRINITY_DN42226_c0_g1_i1.p1  ORF type:complete len:936 (-),score=72.86 TRINITY_DN42226_c0_g1_i1:113-2854(-)
MKATLVPCLAALACGTSEVIVGDVRVQALSSNLLRVEPKGPRGFEDRTTLMVANRHFAGLTITKSTTNKGTILSTDHYQVLLRNGGNCGSGSCNEYRSGFDVTNPVRSPNFPDGATGVSSASQCCDVCSADSGCTAWVFVDSFKGCYPLATYDGVVSSSGTAVGGPGKTCSAQQSSVDVVGPARSANFLDGTDASNAGECCNWCHSDATCVAYVFVESTGRCYPLASYTGTTVGSGRTFGIVGHGGGGASFQVASSSGEVVFDTMNDARSSRLHWPAPLKTKAYGIVDHPRFFVPEWGCAPVPPGAHSDPALADDNGYDYGNQVAGDTYIFVLGSDLRTYNLARKDFVELTGPTPLLPDYAYGTWFTFWTHYTEESAKADVRKWEELNLPLDIWGLDINWRGVNWPQIHSPHQCDYDHPDTNAFPDFDGWFKWLREHNLRTYHNDHPCPQAPQTNPTEIKYRYSGLSKWLGKGMTFWWYDQNWHLGIPPPFSTAAGQDWDGLTTPAWGSHVFWTATHYYDEHVLKPKGDTWYGKALGLTKSFKPDWEPGMDPLQGAEHPSHHRYPVHWTGDKVSLQASVESMVDAGLHSFKPYVHSDCGGDYGQTHANPNDIESAGGLLRWTGHCAYGSILRFHGADHRVWHYDQATQTAFRKYLVARHRLIPTILSAAQRTTETGHPLVARLDMEWPQYPESRSNSQYLFLDDILVAPIFDSTITSRSVWIPPGSWQDAWNPSVVVTGPRTLTASQPVDRIPMWHRRDGGLLLLAHDTNSTRVETQDWSALSVEAFPSQTAASSTRYLHERNGAGSTRMELHTDGYGGIRVIIGQAPVNRSWVVRLHLRPEERLTSASVDGTELSSVAHLHLEPTADKATYFPLFGVGTRLPQGAGAVAELNVAAGSHARSLHAQVETQAVV